MAKVKVLESEIFLHHMLRVGTLTPSFPGLDAPVNEDKRTKSSIACVNQYSQSDCESHI